ncbi:alpha/beta hydrolase-fold protein [Mycoplasmatota bacterium WC44]
MPDRLNTALMGSSMGGLITTYAAVQYNNVFSKYGCLSNAYWFALDELIEDIKNSKMCDLMLYMDVGTSEGGELVRSDDYLISNENVYKELSKKDIDLNYMVFEDAIHNEDEWSIKFPYVIKWLFRREQ